MGSRQSGSFRSFAGYAKRTTSGLNRVHESVARRVAADIVVGTAVGVLSSAVPVVGAAVAGYQAAEMIYTAYSAGDRAYARTGDRDVAITAAGQEYGEIGGECSDRSGNWRGSNFRLVRHQAGDRAGHIQEG